MCYVWRVILHKSSWCWSWSLIAGKRLHETFRIDWQMTMLLRSFLHCGCGPKYTPLGQNLKYKSHSWGGCRLFMPQRYSPLICSTLQCAQILPSWMTTERWGGGDVVYCTVCCCCCCCCTLYVDARCCTLLYVALRCCALYVVRCCCCTLLSY